MVTEATIEVASLRKALFEAEHKADLERKERKKQEARVGEVQEELQELGKKFECVEHELKAKEAELAKALTNIKDAKAEAERAQQEIQEAKKIMAGKKFFMQSKHVQDISFTYTSPELSKGIRRSAMQRIRRRGVLLCSGGELDGEVVLVLVCWGRTSNVSE